MAPRQDPPHAATPERVRINLSWLLKLRSAAVLGQLATIAAVHFGVSVELPLLPLVAIIMLGMVVNLALQVWFARQVRSDKPESWVRVGRHVLGAVLMFDVMLLAALLYFTGGVGNPFVVFFFVNLVLSTVILGRRWLLSVVGVAVAGFALVLWRHVPLPGIGAPVLIYDSLEGGASFQDISLWAWGSLVAFVTVLTFTAYFVRTLLAELLERERELDGVRQRRADALRLEALANLAAGAAHELSSPLSTIAVVAKEMGRELEQSGARPAQAEDAQLIRREVSRCRKILDQMSLDAGESVGEEMVALPIGELVKRALGKVGDAGRVRVELGELRETPIMVPTVAVTRALRALVRNGLDASATDGLVDVRAEQTSEHLSIVVSDRGSGMDAQTLARAGDPFFTTKDPGHGMGLGLFVVRTLAERLGGRLELASEEGRGTRAAFVLPRSEPPPVT